MTGAMYAAIAGLKTHMSALNVIGNNIANVNTYAYKATRYTFDEALYTTSRNGSDGSTVLGGRNPAQIGYGCSIGTIDLDMSTATYAPTGYGLDCMIDGDGFFLIANDKDSIVTTNEGAQGLTLSRLGNLGFDNEGYLVDGNGNLIMGFMSSGPTVDPTTGETVYNYNEALTTIRLPSVSASQRAGYEWDVNYAQIDPTGATATEYSNAVLTANGVAQTTTDYDQVPELDSISIDESTGRITGYTTDDQLVVIGYIAIGRVDNPNGVTHVDGRLYKAMDGAGDLSVCSLGGSLGFSLADAANNSTGSAITDGLSVGSAGETTLVTGGLEASSTDLATEITNMIFMQRGYQANTRIVTVTDSMLEELVNMKR